MLRGNCLLRAETARDLKLFMQYTGIKNIHTESKQFIIYILICI